MNAGEWVHHQKMLGGLFNLNGSQDKANERRECERVKQLALDLIPEAIKVGLHINVSQVRRALDLIHD